MDTDVYLRRIAYAGPVAPTTSTLHALHLAHLLAVPFENLDIHLGRPIKLDYDALFVKIVEQRRGGFCYELNGLFAALLRQIGFTVSLLSAAVAHETGGFGPPFDHLALLVETEEGRLLADVGFGDSFLLPLRLDSLEAQTQPNGVYRMDREGNELTLMRRAGDQDERWKPQYRFTLSPYTIDDFAAMCLYQQTSPESHFTQHRVCSRATSTGRVTLSDLRLIVTVDGTRTEHTLAGEREYRVALRDHFGIVIDE